MRKVLCFLSGLVVVQSFFVTQARGDDFNWTGAGGNSAWTTAGNWLNVTPLGTETVPNGDDNAAFTTSANVSGAGSIQNLNNSATLTYGNGPLVFNNSTVTNTGTLTYLGNGINNNGGGPDETISIASPTTFTGAGKLLLVETNESALTGAGLLTNTGGHTIEGAGTISVNILNTGGIFNLLDNKTIILNNSTLTGGVLNASATSLLSGVGSGLSGVTINGTLRPNTGSLVLSGTIANQGTITVLGNFVNNNGGGPDDNYVVNTPVSLTGGGEFVLVEEGESQILGTGTLTNVNNTLRGQGRIVVANFVNQANVQAEGGNLVISSVVTNTGGTISAAANAGLLLTGATITGGTLTGTAGATLNGGTLADLTITGAFKQVNGITTLTGSLTNNGTLTYNGNFINNNGGGPDDTFAISGAVTFTGTGEIVLLETNESRLTGGALDELQRPHDSRTRSHRCHQPHQPRLPPRRRGDARDRQYHGQQRRRRHHGRRRRYALSPRNHRNHRRTGHRRRRRQAGGRFPQ